MRFSRLFATRHAFRLLLALLVGAPLMGGGMHAGTQTPGMTVTYATGWNLVAFPPNTDISSISTSLYTLQPGDTDYETVAAGQGTQSGFGYWAYFPSSAQVTLDAGSGNLYSVLAPPNQYIMVGNPSGTQSAIVTGANVVYTYDPSNSASPYSQSPALNPGQGAWALSTNGGPISVQATTTAPPATTNAQPPAARFYGAVSLHGQPAPSGTAVSASSSGGANCGSTTVGAAPATGANYALDLTGSDPGCTTAGSAISFTVSGSSAGSGTVPDVSGAVHVDLTVP